MVSVDVKRHVYLKRRGVLGGRGEGGEASIVNQTNTGTVGSEPALLKLMTNGLERICAFASALIPSWTELVFSVGGTRNRCDGWKRKGWKWGVGGWKRSISCDVDKLAAISLIIWEVKIVYDFNKLVSTRTKGLLGIRDSECQRSLEVPWQLNYDHHRNRKGMWCAGLYIPWGKMCLSYNNNDNNTIAKYL